MQAEDTCSAKEADVYLCQVGGQVSCGACCGLYNIRDLSQNKLEALLAERTGAFVRTPRTIEGIEAFQKKIEGWTPAKRPFADFYHCPFLGLIGGNVRRVGCLLHPAAEGNSGTDWRGLSYYGGWACRSYFCPTTRNVPRRYLQILRSTIDHWYLYGLIVTEQRLLTAFFVNIEERLGRPVDAADFAPGSEATAVFREFATLKLDWPYRRADAPGPCNYVFDNGQYPRPAVQRLSADIPVSRYEEIFKELDSGFSSQAELDQAENRIESLLERLVMAIVCPG